MLGMLRPCNKLFHGREKQDQKGNFRVLNSKVLPWESNVLDRVCGRRSNNRIFHPELETNRGLSLEINRFIQVNQELHKKWAKLERFNIEQLFCKVLNATSQALQSLGQAWQGIHEDWGSF